MAASSFKSMIHISRSIYYLVLTKAFQFVIIVDAGVVLV